MTRISRSRTSLAHCETSATKKAHCDSWQRPTKKAYCDKELAETNQKKDDTMVSAPIDLCHQEGT